MNKNLPPEIKKFIDLLADVESLSRKIYNSEMLRCFPPATNLTVGDLRALVEYLNSVRADCKDFQCQQVHDYMDSLAKSLGIEVDAGLLSVIKSTIIQQEISRLQNKSGWQPIASCPKDGRLIIALVHPSVGAAYAICGNANDQWINEVTHWAPVPDFPIQSQSADEMVTPTHLK